jgi:exodeoxyribonuclease VII small subunit
VSDKTPSFREELERLESIVRALEEDDVDLDRALELFESGLQHLKAARTLLEGAELQVKRVIEDAQGTIGTVDLDA